jgi:hypothetical protein
MMLVEMWEMAALVDQERFAPAIEAADWVLDLRPEQADPAANRVMLRSPA